MKRVLVWWVWFRRRVIHQVVKFSSLVGTPGFLKQLALFQIIRFLFAQIMSEGEENKALSFIWSFGSKKKTQEFDYMKIKNCIDNNWKEDIQDAKKLVKFIRYHSNVPLNQNLDLLEETLNELADNEKQEIFGVVIPCLVNHAKSITGRNSHLLPKLEANRLMVELTRPEIACLLANAFLCTLPHSADNPDLLNFSKLYEKLHYNQINQRIQREKIKCILFYFAWVYKFCNATFENETVTFKRIQIDSAPDWKNLDGPMNQIQVNFEGSIFDAFNCAQIDFANERIGGGVLGRGALQEEVRFITCPELIVSRLFSRVMKDNEAIVIDNVLQYCAYEGYGDTFKCTGIMPNTWPIGPHTILAVDALDFSAKSCLEPNQQYQKKYVDRELLKVYAAFVGTDKGTIATGNWGGGCFRGDSILKAKIQLIAASYAKKGLLYFSFKDELLHTQVNQLNNQFIGRNIGSAYKDLLNWCSQKGNSSKSGRNK